MANLPWQPGDALLIVDPQIDFFPGGALAVPQGDEILPLLNQWLAAAESNQISVYISRDWHPKNHCSFQEQGGPWPVHCVQDTPGAEFHPALKVPLAAKLINKADNPNFDAYSAFKGKTLLGQDLTDDLYAQGIKKLWIAGLALDYCVYHSAMDAKAAGFEVHLLLKGTRAIDQQQATKVLKEMTAAGILIEQD